MHLSHTSPGECHFSTGSCGPWMSQIVALTSLTIKARLDYKLNVVAFCQLQFWWDLSLTDPWEQERDGCFYSWSSFWYETKPPKSLEIHPNQSDWSHPMSKQYIYAKGLSLSQDQSKGSLFKLESENISDRKKGIFSAQIFDKNIYTTETVL